MKPSLIVTLLLTCRLLVVTGVVVAVVVELLLVG